MAGRWTPDWVLIPWVSETPWERAEETGFVSKLRRIGAFLCSAFREGDDLSFQRLDRSVWQHEAPEYQTECALLRVEPVWNTWVFMGQDDPEAAIGFQLSLLPIQANLSSHEVVGLHVTIPKRNVRRATGGPSPRYDQRLVWTYDVRGHRIRSIGRGEAKIAGFDGVREDIWRS